MLGMDHELRAEIRTEVSGIVACDDLERAHMASVLRWIDSGAQLCRTKPPATPARHLVSYFVCTDGHNVLLVDHRKAQLWLPPGGHVEPDEHPRATVHREAREELGIEASFEQPGPLMITIAQTQGSSPRHTDVSLWYVLRLKRDHPLIPDSSELNGVRWFVPDDVPRQRSDPHMGRFLRKLAAILPQRC
jgi:8-oxo-dGTP pyrophosphatase MutT (NUDIX family)